MEPQRWFQLTLDQIFVLTAITFEGVGNELLADEQVDEVPGGGVLHSDVGAALNQVVDDAAAVACGGQEQGASAFGVERVYAGALLY